MDWENDSYRKRYLLPSTTEIILGWEGCCLLDRLWVSVDSAGILDLQVEDEDTRYAILADSLRIPEEIVRTGLPRLQRRMAVGDTPWVEIREGSLFLPWYMDAQQTRQSDKARQKRSREARHAAARAGKLAGNTAANIGQHDGPDVTERDTPVTDGDTPVTDGDQTVTSGHLVSPHVTSRGEKSREEERRGETRAAELHECSAPAEPTFSFDEPSSPRLRFDFETPYKHYPKKRGKAEGMETLAKMLGPKAKGKERFGQADYELFCAAMETMGEAWDGRSTKYCPNFSTFASKRYWRDEELPLPDTAGTAGNKTNFAEAAGRESFRGASDDDIGFEGPA